MMLHTRIPQSARWQPGSRVLHQISFSLSPTTRAFTSAAPDYAPQLFRHGARRHCALPPIISLSRRISLSPAIAPPGPLPFSRHPSSIEVTRHYATRIHFTQNASPAAPTSPSPRHLFSRTKRKRNRVQIRNKTSVNGSNGAGGRSRPGQRKPQPQQTPQSPGALSKAGTGAAAAAQAQGKHVLERLPNINRFHRPTKEELLAAATGFWSRLRVRFKWFSIRSLRPFNMDDISAFFSWVLVGHVIWILVGTTTFFSLVILAVNTVLAQETLARWVGNYLTKSSGVKVVFESAIVPRWKDGVITFKNVFVSRRPGQQRSDVRKGSQTAAAAAAAELASERAAATEEDTNYTQYDFSIESIDVTLSFAKWFNGHGLLRDVEIKGVRGVLDRTAVHYNPDQVLDPKTFRHPHNTGDFEIESFKLEDLLISVYQPNNFRPFSVSIFSADLPRLRKQWLFYDFLHANHMSGSYDDSLFTIHPRQTHNYTGSQLASRESEPEGPHWDKQSRIRIDGLKIDHLNRGVEGPFSWIHEGNVDIVADVMFPANAEESIAKVVSDFYDRVEAQVLQQRGQLQGHGADRSDSGQPQTLQAPGDDPIEEGIIRNRPAHRQGNISHSIPLSGTVPASSADTLSAAAVQAPPPPSGQQNSIHPVPHISQTPPPTPPAPSTTPPPQTESPPSTTTPPVILDLSLTLSSVRASIPLFPRHTHLSYISLSLIRPIVSYINSHSSPSTPVSRKPHIPISCRVVKPLGDFEGSWTVWESGLLGDVEREVYEAFVMSVGERERMGRRVRKVGLWGLGVVVQALVVGLAGRVA